MIFCQLLLAFAVNNQCKMNTTGKKIKNAKELNSINIYKTNSELIIYSFGVNISKFNSEYYQFEQLIWD